MSSAKPVSKGVLVSFTSDSEDEGNTSSSSARGSGRDDALSSEDETGRKGMSTAAAVKKKTTSKLEKKSELDDLPVLQTNRPSNGLPASSSSDISGSIASTAIDDNKSSKSKKKSSSDEALSAVHESVDPEERNLAPPSKSKVKNRSKSPKDEKVESSMDVLEERNLTPAISKKREKSPKEAEKMDSFANKTEVQSEQVIEESPDKPLKTKKKKKPTSEERDELENEKPLETSDLKITGDATAKKKKSKDSDENVISPSEAVPSEDVSGLKCHKKKSAKNTDLPTVNGEKDLEIPQASITPESPSLKRKKKKETSDEASKLDCEASASDKRLSAELSGALGSELVSDEKPKKKKSSKSAVDVDTMLTKPSDEGVSVKVIKEDLHKADTPGSNTPITIKKADKPLEAAVQEEKVDAIAVSEVQYLPSNDITIVKPINEDAVTTITSTGSSNAYSNIGVENDGIEAKRNLTKEMTEKLSAEEVAEEEQRVARKKASEDLNDEVARYLQKLPTYTRTNKTDTTEAVPAETSDPLLTPVSPAKPLVTESEVGDENSEFTQRRQSMDDFIKKILAEAREERQRLKGNLEADATILGKVAAGEALSEGTSNAEKEGSMLERRLAAVEKKRLKDTEDGKALIGKTTASGADEEEDEITRIIRTRRAQRKAMEDGLDFDDVESIPSEAGSMRPRVRRARDEFDDDESVSSSKPPLMPGGRSRGARQQQDDDGDKRESFVAKWRRERESSQLPEDSFAPRRSDQTDEVVREKTRHIRIIVEQQADIAKSMRATSRSMDDLDNEIREVRQMALDWQARIEGLEQAIDSEYRQYEADQQAANERLRQQRVPDDRALREELRAIGRNRRLRGESVEDEGFVPGSRRRSGSVASTTSVASSYMGKGGGGGMDSGLELDYYLGGVGGTTGSRRKADESEFSMDRLRRGGSLSRNYSDLLGPDNDDLLAPRSRGGSMRPSADISTSAAPSVSDEVMRIRAKYSTLNNGPSAGYSPSSRLSSGGTDVGGYSSGYASRRDQPAYSSRYGDPTSSSLLSSSRYSSGLGTLGSLGGSSDYSSPLESSRIRRAMSVSDMNYDRPSSYRSSAAYGDPGTDFRSKFLGKGRTTKLDDYSTGNAAASSRSKDKPFKSRFLKSSSGHTDTAPGRHSGGGGSSGEAGPGVGAQE